MHVLTAHGTAPIAGAAGASEHQSSTLGHAVAPVAELQGHGSGHGTDPGTAHMTGVLMLCALVLAAAALLGLVLTVIRRCRRVRLRSLDLPVVHLPAPRWLRWSGPPSAWELSVLRC